MDFSQEYINKMGENERANYENANVFWSANDTSFEITKEEAQEISGVIPTLAEAMGLGYIDDDEFCKRHDIVINSEIAMQLEDY